MKRNYKYSDTSFSVVELVVIVSIFGILAAILIPSLIDRAKREARRDDIATAKLIGEEVMQLMEQDPQFEDSFYCSEGSKADFTVRCDGEQYTIRVVARIDGTRKCRSTGSSSRGTAFDTSSKEYEYVRDALNNDPKFFAGGDGGIILPMKSRSFKAGPDRNTDTSPRDNGKDDSFTDRWLIVHRRSRNNPNGSVEVWAGDSWGQWADGPRVRLWPSPPEDY